MYKICSKCNKVYWRDIEKCLVCKSNDKLKLVMPKKLKVLGKTKVNLASKEHMKIPYDILLLADELGHTQIKKTFKDYKIGSRIGRRKINTKKFLISSKAKYIKKAAVFKVLEYVKENLIEKDILVDINLPNCKDKEGFQAGLMPLPQTLDGLVTFFDDNKLNYQISANQFSKIIEKKYRLEAEHSRSSKRNIKLKVTSIDNLFDIKKEKEVLYLIDANYFTHKAVLSKMNLLFLTNDPDLFIHFFKEGKVNEDHFYGEEAQVILEEIKNFKHFNHE